MLGGARSATLGLAHPLRKPPYLWGAVLLATDFVFLLFRFGARAALPRVLGFGLAAHAVMLTSRSRKRDKATPPRSL